VESARGRRRRGRLRGHRFPGRGARAFYTLPESWVAPGPNRRGRTTGAIDRRAGRRGFCHAPRGDDGTGETFPVGWTGPSQSSGERPFRRGAAPHRTTASETG